MGTAGYLARRVLSLCAMGAGAAAGMRAASAPADSPAIPAARRSVLILNVEQPHLPWVAGLSAGIFATFGAEPASRRPDVQTEYLDAIRMPGRIPDQQAWFRRRYQGQSFDAIIAVTTVALNFVLPLRDELWPGVPIVLLVPQRGSEQKPLPAGVVPVAVRFEVQRTVDLAKAVLPGTRRVAYVAEDGEENARWRSDLAARNLDYVDLTGLRLEDLEKRIANLAPHTVVFFESFHSDGSGRRFVPRDVLARVAPLSSSPIFGVSETMMGHGLTGGWVLDYGLVGVEVARTTLRILAGQADLQAPDPSMFSRLEFDDRELRRWGIPGARVPSEAQVLFREPSLWNDHRAAVLAVVAVLFLQGALITALLVERRRTREARETARRQQTEIAHMNRVAAMGELASSLAHELNQPLTAILTNAQAARRLLTRPTPDLEEVRASLEDIVEDDQRAGDVIHRMRALVRKEESVRTAVDLNEVVRGAQRLVSSDAVLRQASVTLELAAGMPPISGDNVQLQQVVLNLVVNGLDAVAERPPGERRIRVRTAFADGRAEVTVSDSGRGIPDADVAKVFEPFFTTKSHGLGMGLAICRSIVEAHAGRLRAVSLPGSGATFRCEFPIATRGVT